MPHGLLKNKFWFLDRNFLVGARALSAGAGPGRLAVLDSHGAGPEGVAEHFFLARGIIFFGPAGPPLPLPGSHLSRAFSPVSDRASEGSDSLVLR